MTRHAGRLRGARVPLRSGTRASRRSTVVILGLRVRASGSGILLRSACSDAPRGRVLVSGERFPCLPRLSVTSRQPRNTTPRSAFRTSPETPLMSEDDSDSMRRLRYSQDVYMTHVCENPSVAWNIWEIGSPGGPSHPGFQPARTMPTIRLNSGFIRGIPVQSARSAYFARLGNGG